MADVMTNIEQPARERHRPSHRTIGLRLYEDEIAALDRAVSGSGARSRNHLMRRLARRAGGLMDPDPAVIAAYLGVEDEEVESVEAEISS